MRRHNYTLEFEPPCFCLVDEARYGRHEGGCLKIPIKSKAGTHGILNANEWLIR